MMISPEAYMSFLQDKNYKELIKKRDTPMEIIYKYNHLYLSKVYELLYEKSTYIGFSNK